LGLFALSGGPAASGAAPAVPSAGGFSLGASAQDSKSTTAPPAGSLFNLSAPAKEKEATKDSAAPAPLSFALPATLSKDRAPTTPASASGFALMPTSQASTSTQSAPAVASVPAPSLLRGKTIDEIVNRWSSELETQTREFSKFANEIAVWDRALIENSNYISTLYATVLEAEATQNAVDQSLDHIEQQQKELVQALDVYEKEARNIFEGQGGGLRALDVGPADAERDKNYTLAASLHSQLDDVSRSLTQMIESVNSLALPGSPGSSSTSNSQTTGTDDPMTTVVSVLDAHLASLQWISNAVKAVETKVESVGKKLEDTGPNSLNGRNSIGMSSTSSRGFTLR